MIKVSFDKNQITEKLKGIKSDKESGTLLLQLLLSKKFFFSSEDVGEILFENYPQAMNSGVNQLTQQVITKMLLTNCTEEEFYKNLRQYISESPLLENDEEREAALIIVLNDSRLPYFKLNLVSMSDEEFNRRASENEELVDKLRRIALRNFKQKTEQGSAVLDLILQLENEEDRAVLMGIYLSSISPQGIEIR